MVEDLPPPVTRVAPVIDVLHGTKITDPYRWLEDQDAPETRAWIAAQNTYAEEIIGESPLRDAFRSRLTELVETISRYATPVDGEAPDSTPRA